MQECQSKTSLRANSGRALVRCAFWGTAETRNQKIMPRKSTKIWPAPFIGPVGRLGRTFATGASGTACRGAGKLGGVFLGVSLPGRSTPGYCLPTLRVAGQSNPEGCQRVAGGRSRRRPPVSMRKVDMHPEGGARMRTIIMHSPVSPARAQCGGREQAR